MNRTLSITVGVGLLLGVAAWAAWGSASATQPIANSEGVTSPPVLNGEAPDDVTLPPIPPGRGQANYRGDQDRPNRSGVGGPFGFPRSQFTEEDVERARPQADEFWQQYSPERFKTLQSLTPGQLKSLSNTTTRMYLNWQRLKERDADLYGVILNRIQLEDKVFHLVSEMKRPHSDFRAATPELREAVTALVKVSLNERQLRLDRLAKTLKDQQEKLDRDQDPARLDRLVDERMDAVTKDKPYQRTSRPRGR